MILAVLSVSLIGCGTRKIILHPITSKDFCSKNDEGCNCNMDYGMSDYFLNQVLEAKIEKIKR